MRLFLFYAGWLLLCTCVPHRMLVFPISFTGSKLLGDAAPWTWNVPRDAVALNTSPGVESLIRLAMSLGCYFVETNHEVGLALAVFLVF